MTFCVGFQKELDLLRGVPEAARLEKEGADGGGVSPAVRMGIFQVVAGITLRVDAEGPVLDDLVVAPGSAARQDHLPAAGRFPDGGNAQCGHPGAVHVRLFPVARERLVVFGPVDLYQGVDGWKAGGNFHGKLFHEGRIVLLGIGGDAQQQKRHEGCQTRFHWTESSLTTISRSRRSARVVSLTTNAPCGSSNRTKGPSRFR